MPGVEKPEIEQLEDPPFAEWGDVLRGNRAHVANIAHALGTERARNIRRQVVTAAEDYSRHLAEIAIQAGISLPTQGAATLPDDAEIIMAGHQPIVFHCGLLYKLTLMSRLASKVSARAIYVDIDTDRGDGGLVRWPRIVSETVEIRNASLTATTEERAPLFVEQRVTNSETTRVIFEEMVADLERCGLIDAARRARAVGVMYEALSGQPIVVANAIVRWATSGLRYSEVPLSAIVATTELASLVQEMVLDGDRLADMYNSCLDEYRQAHGIRNLANPFPNLSISEAGQELPFWRMSSGKREPLLVSKSEKAVLPPNDYIAPRAGLITLLLRAYCADLFIHGTGGGKYDRYVDALAARYLGQELPRFVVASATRFIDPARVESLRRSLARVGQFKEMISHTENFLGRSIFTPEEEQELAARASERRAVRARLERANTAEERSAISHELNDLNRQIRAFIEGSSLRVDIQSAGSRSHALERWQFREFPSFLFSAELSADLA